MGAGASALSFAAKLEESLMTPILEQPTRRHRLAFVYLGRNPAFSSFVLELAQAAALQPAVAAEFVVADGTELADRLRDRGTTTCALPTNNRSTLSHALLGYIGARRLIIKRLRSTRPEAVVTLMPHIWSPLLTPAIKRIGIHYATTIHDVEPHPGDPTAWATRWLASDASRADVVFTLSRAVANLIEAKGLAPRDRIVRLFHPDIGARAQPVSRRLPVGQRPFRVLFFGRIMAYKGLSILVDAVERLRAENFPVELGVAGSGSVDGLRPRLAALGAEVIERWIPPDELLALLDRYDAMACSHVEASQSGVAALAFGNGMPVIGTPVGGLVEQVVDGKTGVLARDASVEEFARAVKRLMTEPGLYEAIVTSLAVTSSERSMARFLDCILQAVARLPARAVP